MFAIARTAAKTDPDLHLIPGRKDWPRVVTVCSSAHIAQRIIPDPLCLRGRALLCYCSVMMRSNSFSGSTRGSPVTSTTTSVSSLFQRNGAS
jgi:hypothetical protein